MAAVIQFPSPLDAPVVQAPRRGRLPNGIGSLRAVRMKRVREARGREELRASDTRSVWRALLELADDASAEGWVGFVLVGVDDKGNAYGKAGVRCIEDQGSARRLVEWLRLCV